MSIIVRMSNGNIKMFSKGADSAITSRLSYKTKYLIKTREYLLDFARKGLRTIMISQRNLSENEYEEWNQEYQVK